MRADSLLTGVRTPSDQTSAPGKLTSQSVAGRYGHVRSRRGRAERTRSLNQSVRKSGEPAGTTAESPNRAGSAVGTLVEGAHAASQTPRKLRGLL